jgi:hypothetical protein
MNKVGTMEKIEASITSASGYTGRRMAKDKLFKYVMVFGGLSVIVAISTIFFYLAGVVAPLFMPLLARVPLRLLYPLGGAQGRWGSTPLGPQGFGLVAGEFHLMRRRMPRHLQGTTILASSLGERDARELKERGAPRVFATMPSMGGARFGANAVEAALLASGHLDPAKGNYQEAWERSGLPPGVLQEVLP